MGKGDNKGQLRKGEIVFKSVELDSLYFIPTAVQLCSFFFLSRKTVEKSFSALFCKCSLGKMLFLLTLSITSSLTQKNLI